MVGSIAAACRPVPAARTSLLVETNSLFVITGNLPLPLWKGVGILALIRPGESDFGRVPCIFPAHQGSRARDEFAPDCLHRHGVRDSGESVPGVRRTRSERSQVALCGTDKGLALAHPVVRVSAAARRVTTDLDPFPENFRMSAVLLVTCWICRRLHPPVHPLALNPICADCASKSIPQTTTSPASG